MHQLMGNFRSIVFIFGCKGFNPYTHIWMPFVEWLLPLCQILVDFVAEAVEQLGVGYCF